MRQVQSAGGNVVNYVRREQNRNNSKSVFFVQVVYRLKLIYSRNFVLDKESNV